jgi:hypothetical protein
LKRLNKYPNKSEPDIAKNRYTKNTLGLTIPKTAIIAGRVVTGPEIKNANAAPWFIPAFNSPLTKGKAVILLV